MPEPARREGLWGGSCGEAAISLCRRVSERLAAASVKSEVLWRMKEMWRNPTSEDYEDRADATISIDNAMRRLSPEERKRVADAVKSVLAK